MMGRGKEKVSSGSYATETQNNGHNLNHSTFHKICVLSLEQGQINLEIHNVQSSQ